MVLVGHVCKIGIMFLNLNFFSLQMGKTSHQDSIHPVYLDRLLDMSEIQPVMINGAEAVYLKPKGQQDWQENVGKNWSHGNRCEGCNSELFKENYKFCSVFCMRFILDLHEKKDNKDGNCGGSSMRPEEKYPSPITVKRDTFRPIQRKRKGIPKRSPFF
ncbi:uncharacterized protein LOC122661863 [Telopea speciosissima]|uniref:uncharacterized protein LOC122661863 n=1 Tax=Telopea speciosissima TaxID=54955 RepID=UPI001CC5A7F8|nr:uncharacterized protein LOC122661863 [Telopea speciosissima]